ncbi:MAG: glycoside hydrolase family 130 protein [Bryobacteraceae bacterium]
MVLPASVALVVLAGSDATLTELGEFQRPPESKPVITPQPRATFTDPILRKPVQWEALHTFNPAAIVREGKVYVLYRAEDNSGSMEIGMHTSRLGLAESADGVHFEQHGQSVFYPDRDSEQSREWPGGVEDPRIVESDGGTYVLTYTQWNRSTYRVGIATSNDLLHWTKHGPAFGLTGKYASLAYKSAGILTHLAGDRLVAARVNGKYWMYWGEIEVRIASSTDLVHWTPEEGNDGKALVLLAPRPGRFDSALPEVGPPPVLTERGIVLLYNGKNATKERDTNLAPGTYAAGQATFAADNPAKLLSRSDTPFFQPQMAWERSGQYAAGTTFAEGLVRFRQRWFLYYGCADSFVGVASTKP